MRVLFGGAGTIVLMIAALWIWQEAASLVEQWRRPEVALWSLRSAAIGAAAAAQVILLTFVVGGIYRRGLAGEVLRLSAGLVFTIATVSAVALGLAGH